jgi:hypothetical protein
MAASWLLLFVLPAQSLDYSNDATAERSGKRAQRLAESPGAAVADLHGEWRRAGAGFACTVTSKGRLPPEAVNPDVLAKACLHMGPFMIGGAAQSVTSLLGAAPRTMSQPGDATALIYFLDRPGQMPYLVATVQKDQIVALQVSGRSPVKAYGFNHVNLGDDTKTVLKYFGAANKIGPSGEAGTDLWSYGPWPFSFEMRDGYVSSIRIVDPAYRQ